MFHTVPHSFASHLAGVLSRHPWRNSRWTTSIDTSLPPPQCSPPPSVQMRFPTDLQGELQAGRQLNHPVGSPHQFTLLDGEMVVDQGKEPGAFVRRWASIQGLRAPSGPWVQVVAGG